MAGLLPDAVAQCTARRQPGTLELRGDALELVGGRLLAPQRLELAGEVVQRAGADGQAAALEPVRRAGDLDVVAALGGEHDALDDRRRGVDEGGDDLTDRVGREVTGEVVEALV